MLDNYTSLTYIHVNCVSMCNYVIMMEMNTFVVTKNIKIFVICYEIILLVIAEYLYKTMKYSQYL